VRLPLKEGSARVCLEVVPPAASEGNFVRAESGELTRRTRKPGGISSTSEAPERLGVASITEVSTRACLRNVASGLTWSVNFTFKADDAEPPDFGS
jgi:hypothetical protein